MLFTCLLLSLVACGKDKGKDGGGGGTAAAAGGPACSEAAAQYAKLEAEGFGNHLAGMKPPATPDQVKIVAGKLEAHCTSAPWTAADKTCVMTAKDNMAVTKTCFKAPKGFGLQVSQVVFDAVAEFKAAGSAATGGVAPNPDGTPDGSASK